MSTHMNHKSPWSLHFQKYMVYNGLNIQLKNTKWEHTKKARRSMKEQFIVFIAFLCYGETILARSRGFPGRRMGRHRDMAEYDHGKRVYHINIHNMYVNNFYAAERWPSVLPVMHSPTLQYGLPRTRRSSNANQQKQNGESNPLMIPVRIHTVIRN